MPYVQRDNIGQIVGLFAEPQDQEDVKATQWLEEDDPEVIQFRERFFKRGKTDG